MTKNPTLTPEQIKAGAAAVRGYDDRYESAEDAAVEIYEAIIDAAPKQKGRR